MRTVLANPSGRLVTPNTATRSRQASGTVIVTGGPPPWNWNPVFSP